MNENKELHWYTNKYIEEYAHGCPWYKSDPRFSINKRANIIIINLISKQMAIGRVETKEEWYIETGFESYKFISAADDWPNDHVWTWMPNPTIKTFVGDL